MAMEPLAREQDLRQRLKIAQRMVEENLLRIEETRSRLEVTRARISRTRPQREVLFDSAYARMAARLESLPVIEQAKGILIADSGCTPDEAFDILRRASQRTNVQVKQLAADIVNRTIGRGRAGSSRRSGSPAVGSGNRRLDSKSPSLRPLPPIPPKRAPEASAD